ncbi:hypothetical protein BOVA514_5248 [Bacteroides ovatus]|nr:hypothetical protein BOVA514_5248 [Bacteroides ovatus]
MTNACAKNSQKPEIGSTIHQTIANARIQYPKIKVLVSAFFNICNWRVCPQKDKYDSTH